MHDLCFYLNNTLMTSYQLVGIIKLASAQRAVTLAVKAVVFEHFVMLLL